MELPMKLVIEVPVYRKPSRKLEEMVNRLAECRVGKVKYNREENTFDFESFNPKSTFRISEVYFKNPDGQVEFEKFRKFRSVLNLIISVIDEDATELSLELINCPEDTIKNTGVHSNITLTLTTTSVAFFTQITQHLELLDF